MKKEIRLYIEGAAKSSEAARLREGFRVFLDPLYQLARQKGFRFHQPITCASGLEAYEEFKVARKVHKDAILFLLVDSETPIVDNTAPWAHLKWDPLGLDDLHCHLMAQSMEAWLVADKVALADFYKQGFNQNALPQNPHVEEIPKKDLIDGLRKATAKTQKKKPYHKTEHAPEILKRLNVKTVCDAAPHCKRLFDTLTEKMN